MELEFLFLASFNLSIIDLLSLVIWNKLKNNSKNTNIGTIIFSVQSTFRNYCLCFHPHNNSDELFCSS